MLLFNCLTHLLIFFSDFIQPHIEDALLDSHLMEKYRSHQSSDYQVLFLDEPGLHVTLPTISPVWVSDDVVNKVYRGKLIHHGEMFELARYFGRDAPFMTYVYKNNPHMDQVLTYSLPHSLTHPLTHLLVYRKL